MFSSTHNHSKLLRLELCRCPEHLAVIFPLRRIVEGIKQLKLIGAAERDPLGSTEAYLFVDSDVDHCGVAWLNVAAVGLDHVATRATYAELRRRILTL